MKIIEKDEFLKKEEDDKNSYLLKLQFDRKFQKYYVRGIVLPVLKNLRDLKWIYSNEQELLKASDEEIADIIRNNRVNYSALVKLLTPIIDEEIKEEL
ncbi:MAG: hypothetical protein COZ25_07385 [Ignavibacteria bacterium CG_4_10_14_3_um_filter_37_18]|nr:MAG: hypothetical protein COZ25_07385 [Ignavibacteria bacterium CG_4_10_14_3_um_filter_37_18]